MLHLRPDRPAQFPGAPLAAFLWLPIASEEQANPSARWLAGNFVLENLSLGRRVLLHSSLSRHRTRWAFVAYLICSGRPVSAALRAAEARPWLAPYRTRPETWQAFAELVQARRALDQPPVPAR